MKLFTLATFLPALTFCLMLACSTSPYGGLPMFQGGVYCLFVALGAILVWRIAADRGLVTL